MIIYDGIKQLRFKYMGIVDVNVVLRDKYTILGGNSATGKTYLYNIIKAYARENNKKSEILCLNLDNVDLDRHNDIMDQLKEMNNGIIVIDQADYILRCGDIKDFMTHDYSNYYLVMSRNLIKNFDDFAYLKIDKTSITLAYGITTVQMKKKLAKLEGEKNE